MPVPNHDWWLVVGASHPTLCVSSWLLAPLSFHSQEVAIWTQVESPCKQSPALAAAHVKMEQEGHLAIDGGDATSVGYAYECGAVTASVVCEM